MNKQKRQLLSKWKEEKRSDDRVNNIALNHALLNEGRDDCKGDLSAKDILKLAASEIEERANTRHKVSLWKQQKEKEKEESLVSIYQFDIILHDVSFIKSKL